MHSEADPVLVCNATAAEPAVVQQCSSNKSKQSVASRTAPTRFSSFEGGPIFTTVAGHQVDRATMLQVCQRLQLATAAEFMALMASRNHEAVTQ